MRESKAEKLTPGWFQAVLASQTSGIIVMQSGLYLVVLVVQIVNLRLRLLYLPRVERQAFTKVSVSQANEQRKRLFPELPDHQ